MLRIHLPISKKKDIRTPLIEFPNKQTNKKLQMISIHVSSILLFCVRSVGEIRLNKTNKSTNKQKIAPFLEQFTRNSNGYLFFYKDLIFIIINFHLFFL